MSSQNDKSDSPQRPDRPDAEDDIYQTTPLDPDGARRRWTTLPPGYDQIPEDAPEDQPTERIRFQYTLADLLILMTASAVFLGMMSLLAWRWQYVAGVAGIVAFVSLVVLTAYEPEGRAVRVAWWIVLGLYLLACLVAIITGR